MSCETSSVDLDMEMLDDEPCEQKLEFWTQISELQDAVHTMKSAFMTAQLQLAGIGQEDKTLHEELTVTKSQCQQQSSEILRLVLTLKSEISSLRETLETTQMIQHGLESRLQSTLLERDLILDELAKNGAVSQQLRDKLISCHNGNGVYAGRSSSGSQSTNDSGVALFLENKPHHHNLVLDFNSNGDGGRININDGIHHNKNPPSSSSSSTDSANNLNSTINNNLYGFNPLIRLNENSIPSSGLPEIHHTHSSTHHHVQSYLNTLSSHNIHHNNIVSLPKRSHLHNENDYPSLNSNTTESSSNNNNNEHLETSPRGRGMLAYDSDSSLTVAATKSLTLSTSLSKQCGLELDQHHDDHDDDDVQEIHYNNSTITHRINNYQNGLLRDEDGDGNSSDDHELPNSTSSARVHILEQVRKEAVEPIQKKKELDSQRNEVGQREIKSATSKMKTMTRDDDEKDLTLILSFEENQRLKVAKELVETEKKYCHTLKTIQDVFASPLKQSNILIIKDINTLFPEEVGRMYGQHCQLLMQLEQRISSWTQMSNIGDLLEGFTRVDGSNVLRLYTSYVNDFPEVLKTFHKLCRTNGDFTKFLKQCLEQPICGGLDLGAFLLTPVQRMPRYILLLKQMIKWTNPSHKDYANITICLNRLRDYLTKLNDSMEHSFQLVTAQIIPQQQQQRRRESTANSIFERNLSTGGCNQNLSLRSSVSSESSCAGNIDEKNKFAHKIRYKRSVSATRSQNESSPLPSSWTPRRDSSSSICSKINKLKCKSKSDWTVCKNKTGSGSTSEIEGRCQKCSNCNNYNNVQDDEEISFITRQQRSTSICSSLNQQLLDRSISESDINSDADEDGKERTKNFTASKSLHDFHQHKYQMSLKDNDDFDWAISEPSLSCSESRSNTLSDRKLINNPTTTREGAGQSIIGRTVLRKNTLLRPFLPPPFALSSSSSLRKDVQIAKIERGSQPELSLKGKKVSLRASLKNIFSLKKRYSKINSSNNDNSNTETESKYYRVVYTDNNHLAPFPAQHMTECSSSQPKYFCQNCTNSTAAENQSPLNISPLIQYLHRMPSYLELVMFSVKETTV